jgi:hypothetical protein
MPPFNWFDLNWVWIGLSGSLVLWILLLTTNIFRSDLSVSRWFDNVWLAWLAPAAYAIHQTEEYGIDALGQHFAFPNAACSTLGLPPYPDCPIPKDFFVAVNIPAIWILGLICALLSRRHPLIGLGLYGIFITNAVTHIGNFIVFGQYNPGTLTAFVIQIPFSLWVFYVMVRSGRNTKAGVFALVLAGALLSATLFGSLKLSAGRLVPDFWILAIQIVNPLWMLVVPWLQEKRARTSFPVPR